MVDLHTHSNASDGDLSPELLIQEAVKLGLCAIALTDHDTINGLCNAIKAAQKMQIQLIPGIEININWKAEKALANITDTGYGGEFHLLGLGIHKPSPAFKDSINKLAKIRDTRNHEILEKMNKTGIKTVWEDISSLSGGNSIGRMHFARLLIKLKIVKNMSQAFERYLSPGKPLFVPKECLMFEEAAALILESGGIPILAHPGSLYVSWGRLPDLIKALKNRGLAGLEAWHPAAKPGYCKRLEELGKKMGLYVTEGSDFHGFIRPERKLGFSNKNRKINDEILENIPMLSAK